MYGAVISATLVFDCIAVTLRTCRHDDARDIVISGSSWAEDVDVLSGL